MNVLTTKYNLPGFGDYAVAALKVLIVVLFLVVLWLIIDRITRFDDEKELFLRRNMAYAVLRISIVGCQVIALLPLVGVNSGGTVWEDVGPLLGWGAAVTVVVLLLNVVLDRVLHRGGGTDALTTISMADAVSRGGFYLATGLIVNAALSGTAPSLGEAIAASIVFAALGLVALLLGYVVLGLIGPFRSRGKVGGNDLAAAVISAGVVVGLGFILRLAIAGDFAGWAAGLIGFAVTFVLGYVVLVVLIFVLDALLVRSHNLRQIVTGNETVAASVMAAVLVSVALVIGSVAI
jgi:uncharacterized membrane protein YjfL (UPF0719 family)